LLANTTVSGKENTGDGLLKKDGLSNLESLEAAIKAYKKRFGIEEMFRDFKRGVITGQLMYQVSG